ncbi:MAG: trehalose-phosphatase [Candidatus Omnitrophica bacterium]|nr:trehalose-phosphatase [Candidatus Omnitrophota bacterium]
MKNLFKYWDDLKDKLNNKYIMLFLDYDGTLAPIVSTPEKALISKEVKYLISELSKIPNCKLAIISGRALKDIKNIVGLKGIIYSGNHGLEIERPKIKFESQVSARYKATLELIMEDLKKRLYSIKNAFIEDKGLSLSIHYRLVDKKDIPKVKTIFHETIILYLVRNKIKVKTGKMVLEIRPPYEWDKGKVVMWLLARQQFALKDNGVFPIYLGDDVTDEDAFNVLKNRGMTIFVGKPKPSHARYYLKNTDEVGEFLKRILEIQEGKLT